jgi:hypothetical protein
MNIVKSSNSVTNLHNDLWIIEKYFLSIFLHNNVTRLDTLLACPTRRIPYLKVDLIIIK